MTHIFISLLKGFDIFLLWPLAIAEIAGLRTGTPQLESLYMGDDSVQLSRLALT